MLNNPITMKVLNLVPFSEAKKSERIVACPSTILEMPLQPWSSRSYKRINNDVFKLQDGISISLNTLTSEVLNYPGVSAPQPNQQFLLCKPVMINAENPLRAARHNMTEGKGVRTRSHRYTISTPNPELGHSPSSW